MSLTRVALSLLLITLASACDPGSGTGARFELGPQPVRGRIVVIGTDNARDIAVNLFGPGVARSTRTTEDGSFAFDAVPVGLYFLTPAAPYLEPESLEVRVFDSAVDLGDVHRVAAGEVSGTVVLPDGVDPTRAAVTIEGSLWVAHVDASGHYTLPWAPAGERTLLAVAPGCLPARTSITFQRGEKVTASDLVLQLGTPEVQPEVSGTTRTSAGTIVTIEGTELSDTVDAYSGFKISNAPLGISHLILSGPFVHGRIEFVLFPRSSGQRIQAVTRQNDIVAQQLISLDGLPVELSPPFAPEDSTLVRLPSEHGSKALFLLSPDDGSDLVLRSFDSEDQKQIVVSDKRGKNFQFTPDGTSLFYEVPPENHVGFSFLKRLPVDRETPTVVADNMMASTPFLISPDGVHVVYVACCESSSVVLRALNVTDNSVVTLGELDQANLDGWANSALFTPDSQRLVYLNEGQLFVATFDSMPPMALAELSADSTFQLTNDGKRVIFAEGRPGPLFSADVAGESEPITLDGSGLVLAVSADDTQVLVMSTSQRVRFMALGTTVIDHSTYVSTATLLPDGENIVWRENDVLRVSSLPKVETVRDAFCVQTAPALAFTPSHGMPGDPIVFPLSRTFEHEALQLPTVDLNGRQELFHRTAESRLCFSGYGRSVQFYQRGRTDEIVGLGLEPPTAFPYVPHQTMIFERPTTSFGYPSTEEWPGGFFALSME